MICRSCGGKAAKRDTHCVYCGKKLRLVPNWAKLLTVPVIAVVVTVSVPIHRTFSLCSKRSVTDLID